MAVSSEEQSSILNAERSMAEAELSTARHSPVAKFISNSGTYSKVQPVPSNAIGKMMVFDSGSEGSCQRSPT